MFVWFSPHSWSGYLDLCFLCSMFPATISFLSFKSTLTLASTLFVCIHESLINSKNVFSINMSCYLACCSRFTHFSIFVVLIMVGPFWWLFMYWILFCPCCLLNIAETCMSLNSRMHRWVMVFVWTWLFKAHSFHLVSGAAFQFSHMYCHCVMPVILFFHSVLKTIHAEHLQLHIVGCLCISSVTSFDHWYWNKSLSS